MTYGVLAEAPASSQEFVDAWRVWGADDFCEELLMAAKRHGVPLMQDDAWTLRMKTPMEAIERLYRAVAMPPYLLESGGVTLFLPQAAEAVMTDPVMRQEFIDLLRGRAPAPAARYG